MCGIVAAVAQRPIAEVLLFGLHALEYRGYDSAGLYVTDSVGNDFLIKNTGKVSVLEQEVHACAANGTLGIAHTRWATHGAASVVNAHPHQVGDITLVHNGIIENYKELKIYLQGLGYVFKSATDTEGLAALIDACYHQEKDILQGLRKALSQVKGSYALAMVVRGDNEHFYVARNGSPLVIGRGFGENFAASDVLALVPVTSRFIYLEDGDIGVVGLNEIALFDAEGHAIERETKSVELNAESLGKGHYKHYMQKEIFEQPEALQNTMLGRLDKDNVNEAAFGYNQDYLADDNLDAKILFAECLKNIKHIEIVACGTSYHAGLIGKYFIEEYTGVSANVTVASEYRYKRTVVPEHSLFVTISQSGETADTLAALNLAKRQGYEETLCICNVANSSLVRESGYAFLTRAGTEIGVASTKAFTTQLLALNLLMLALGRANGSIDSNKGREFVQALKDAPAQISKVLELDAQINDLAWDFVGKAHCLYLGRGPMYPLALEGALKLKEISYIHAEGYAAGELKHGPIALIDEQMPVIVVAPDNELLPKLISNIEEVRARGGRLYVFSDSAEKLLSEHNHEDESRDLFNQENKESLGPSASNFCRVLHISKSKAHPIVSPMLFTIPLQLLAYHVAVINGTDVDQPRNLAKSVTVE